MAASGSATTADGLARAAARAWLPLTLALLLPRRTRRVAALLALGPAPLDWYRRRPRVDLLRWSAMYLLDDASYCAGL